MVTPYTDQTIDKLIISSFAFDDVHFIRYFQLQLRCYLDIFELCIIRIIDITTYYINQSK